MYLTGNPIGPDGSSDPRDLSDNAQILDVIATDTSKMETPSRLGELLTTVAGLKQIVIDYLAAQGFEAIHLQYVDGQPLTVLRPTQLIDRGGSVYRVRMPSTFPVTLTGTWATDAPLLTDVGDAALRQALASPGGAALIGTVQGPLDEYLSELSSETERLKSAITPTIAPSLPTLGDLPKLVIRPDGSTGPFYVVTRKANGKSGYVAIQIENTATPPDDENIGGLGNFRPTLVLNLLRAMCAKTLVHAKTAGATLSALVASQVDQIWGYSLGGGSVAAAVKVGSADFSYAARNVYSLAASGDSVTYSVTKARCRVRIGMTPGSSSVIKIQVSPDGTNFFDYQTTTARAGAAGSVTGRDIPVEFSSSATWYVRVLNQTVESAPVYVAGLNFGDLPDALTDIDTAAIVQAAAIGGVPNQYQGGAGANEFAARPVGGKWFGTYHGGHSGFLQRLRTDSASYNLDSSMVPVLLMVSGLQMHSTSLMENAGTSYRYTAETIFGDGAHATHYAVELVSGTPLRCTNLYTHMCTTQRDFNYIHVPKMIVKEDDGNVLLGQCDFIQQFKASDGIQLNTYFSRFMSMEENGLGGAYVSFQPGYNKQYYGPAVSSVVGVELTNFSVVTAKEYL